jgi:hypothetical protein
MKIAYNPNDLTNKEIKTTKLVILLCLNTIIGNFPSKIAPILFYFMDPFSYNVYVSITNGILFLSLGNIFFINFFFNDDFYQRFLQLIGRGEEISQVQTSSIDNNRY